MISEIVAGIKTQIGVTLPDYTEVPFIFDPRKNVLGALEQGYFVSVLRGEQTTGVVKTLTITREFSVTLTREYYGNQLNDTSIANLEIETLNDIENLYGAMAETNLNSSRVLNVHSMVSEDPNIDYDNKNIQFNMSFSVQYIRRI